MAFVQVPLTAQVELWYTSLDVQVENVLYFQSSLAINEARLTTLLEYVSDWWYAEIRPLQSITTTLRGVAGRSLNAETAPTGVSLTYAGQTGLGDNGVDVPGNVTYAISFRTAMRGRAHRGRNYVIGLRTSSTAGNSIIAATRNAYVAAYAKLMSGGGYILSPFTWVVVSRYLNNQVRSPGITTTITNVTTTNDWLDSQRRRLFGRGT